jgi:hypothetical protein
MTATPATSQYLKTYISERLPVLGQGPLNLPGDPPSFTVDQRYVPLRDPVYQG